MVELTSQTPTEKIKTVNVHNEIESTLEKRKIGN